MTVGIRCAAGWVAFTAALVVVGGPALWGCRDFQLGCRTDGDCALRGVDLVCLGENDSPGCGAPPIEACQVEEDCDQSNGRRVCDTVSEPDVGCGRGSTCVLACSATTCAEGERCDDVSGLCRPVSCREEAAVCRSTERCAPGDEGANGHGCVLLACSDDGDCVGGDVCVTGRCSVTVGNCGRIIVTP